MLSVDLRTGPLAQLAKGFGPRHEKSLRRAFMGEGYRLRSVMQDEFRAGIGPPKAPLTRATARDRRSQDKALAAIGRRIAYRVQGRAGTMMLTVGPGQWRRRRQADGSFRMNIGALPIPFIEALAAGGSHRIGREEQAWIAYKLRKRMGEPVKSPRRADPTSARWTKRRGRYRAGRAKWKTIEPGIIPRQGTSLHWPARRWVADVLKHERHRSPLYIRRLYEMQLNGERWGKGKWWTTGEFRRLGAGSPSGVRSQGGATWRVDARPWL